VIQGRRDGVLRTVAILLLLSAAVRVGAGVEHALAETGTGAQATAEGTGGIEKPATDPSGEEAKVLLAALRDREARLADRERAADKREADLAKAKAEVEARLADLQAAEAELAKTITQSETAADEDIARLVAVYEAMKPKEAQPLFAAMDPEFAAGFLGRMRPDAAAAILSGLDPERAYAITLTLAGRNANAPKN
jgi:flagellar motility protein MotE (MotC chaperone)